MGGGGGKERVTGRIKTSAALLGEKLQAKGRNGGRGGRKEKYESIKQTPNPSMTYVMPGKASYITKHKRAGF